MLGVLVMSLTERGDGVLHNGTWVMLGLAAYALLALLLHRLFSKKA
jgi:hypothetical protein